MTLLLTHGYLPTRVYVLCVTERTRLLSRRNVSVTLGHSATAQVNFRCAASSDDSTSVTAGWYKLQQGAAAAAPTHGYLPSGRLYSELRVENMTDRLTVSPGPDHRLTIRLPANDSHG